LDKHRFRSRQVSPCDRRLTAEVQADTTAPIDRLRVNTRLGGLIAALGVVLAGAAVAYASFSATGTGSGHATAVTAQSIPITAASCPGNGDLYPGGPAGAICFTLKNPNPYTVTFTSVTYLPSNTPIVAGSASCAAANVSIATGAPTTLATPLTVAPGQTTGTLSIPGVIQMASTADDGCQGASFDVPITLNGSQQ
jgi:hypothetical protein